MSISDSTPAPLVIEQYLDRDLLGRGAISVCGGRIKTRLTVNARGRWNGSELILGEIITYKSRKRHRRVFTIKKLDRSRYRSESPEFVGTGKIRSYGGRFRWCYRLKERSREAVGVALRADDWLYLSHDGQIIDHAQLSKFVFKVGDVFMSLGPVENSS